MIAADYEKALNDGSWTDAENAAVVALYFRMLDAATTGKRYNKAALIRLYRGRPKAPGTPEINIRDASLYNRSRGSIEAKLMNCSAAHRDLDPTAVTMDGFGYRALSNYQASLRNAMHAAITRRLMQSDGYRDYVESKASRA